ncbi:MAG: acyltransferase [Hyphomonadaceae bacterium]|nr:acyltransferase [Hyphomonadaceae bacterium]
MDALRAGAALLVLFGHVRHLVLVHYATIEAPSLIERAFYAVTTLGHSAVIIFFALSGYLVGGQALSAMLAKRWSWRRYLLRRMTRLWIVVLPALALTWVFDSLSVKLDPEGLRTFLADPFIRDDFDHSLRTLLANVFFLQDVVAPTYGTNGPLWSLSNEFWYYLILPVAFSLVLIRQGWALRLLSIAVLGTATLLLPFPLVVLGVIWLAGALTYLLATNPRLQGFFRHGLVRLAALALVVGGFVFDHRMGLTPDIALGFAVAAALPVIAHLPSGGTLYRAVATRLASFSYTLYVVHFPYVAFVAAVLTEPTRWRFGFEGVGIFAAVVAGALLLALVMWWLFERHTDAVFRYLSSLTLARRKPVAGVAGGSTPT